MEGKRWGRRPLASHRFAIEVEVVTAGDLDLATIARSLTQLATAGLHGMVTRVGAVSLDGLAYTDALEDPPREALRAIRPPPDVKTEAALREIERIVASLRRPEQPVVPVVA